MSENLVVNTNSTVGSMTMQNKCRGAEFEQKQCHRCAEVVAGVLQFIISRLNSVPKRVS